MAPVAVAGQNCDVVLDTLGILTVPGSMRQFDLSNFSPAVRSDNPRYSDFSLSQFWAQDNWSHGRGALEWGDPDSYYDSANVWTHIRNQITLAALQNLTTKAAAASVGGNPVCLRLVTTAANLFTATGGGARDVFQWNNSTAVWVAEVSGIAADPTDMTEWQGVIWVANGEANNMRVKSGGAWADGGVPADFLAVFNNTALYRADNINEIYWATALASPASATVWNGPLYVGDTNTSIRSLAVADGRLWVGKDDGLYYIQDQVVTQLLDFQWARDPNNFRWMKWWQGALYFPIQYGLYRLVGSTLQAIGPNRGAQDESGDPTFKGLASGKRGQIVDLIPVGDFLYAVVDAGTGGTSQILCYNGTGWHQLVQGAASGTRIRSAFFTGPLATTGVLSLPRLWFGYGNDVYNIILPLNTDDPFEDTTNQTYFAGTIAGGAAFLLSSWFDAGLANVWKEFIGLQLYTEGLTANEQVLFQYVVDGDTTYQSVLTPAGVAYNFTASPYQAIPLPQNTIGKKIRGRLILARGGTTTLTPKIKAMVVEYAVRPDTKFAWQVTARAGRHMRNPYLSGQYEDLDAGEWLQLLTRYRDSRTRLLWDPGDMEPGITNLVLNPSFELDTNADGLADNWTEVLTPSTAIAAQYKIYGRRSQRVIEAAADQSGIQSDDMTTVVGTRYTASVYLYIATKNVTGLANPGGTSGIAVQLRDTGGTVLASATLTSPTDQWVRVEATGIAISTATHIRIVIATVPVQANAFFVSAAQLEVTPDARFLNFGTKATTFCSGDQPRCRWNGTPQTSTSVRDGKYLVFVTNINVSEIKRPSIMDRIRGQGNEQRITLSLAQVE